GELGPRVRPFTWQVQLGSGDQQAAVAQAAHDVLALHIVGEGDGGLAGVRLGLGADGQLAVQHDPLGGQLHVAVVGEGQFAVDRQTVQCWRTDVEYNVRARGDGDDASRRRNCTISPGGSGGPVSALCRGGFSLSADSEAAGSKHRKKIRNAVACNGKRAHGRTPELAHSLSCTPNSGATIAYVAFIPNRAPWLWPPVRIAGRLPPECSPGPGGKELPPGYRLLAGHHGRKSAVLGAAPLTGDRLLQGTRDR